MGHMRFRLPQADTLSEEAVRCVYMSGMDGIPWPSKNSCQDSQLVITRGLEESGNVHVPWQVDGHGVVVLSTASCMERDSEYLLVVELARGTLSRIKGFAADWAGAALDSPPGFDELLERSTRFFVRAATNQHNPSAATDDAQQSIKAALDAIATISEAYSHYMISLRREHESRLSTMVAVNVGSHSSPPPDRSEIWDAFNSVSIPFSWRDIERNEGEFDWTLVDAQITWAQSKGLRICAGPLLRLDRQHLPDWIYLWEERFDEIQAAATRFIQQVARRYHQHVHVWNCAAGLNRDGALELTEEEHLRLAVTAISNLRTVDEASPIILSFDRPWGDYLAQEQKDLSPLYFAEALTRADLGLAGIGLEFNYSYWPEGTLQRDLLEFNRHLERWAALGSPLIIFFTVPSDDAPDSQASQSAAPTGIAGTPSPESQKELAHRLLTLFLAKPMIHGIIWNQLADGEPHDFPHSGVLDASGAAKPVLHTLKALRQTHVR